MVQDLSLDYINTQTRAAQSGACGPKLVRYKVHFGLPDVCSENILNETYLKNYNIVTFHVR